MEETTRFHPARWQRLPSGACIKICDICGKRIGDKVARLMLDELVNVADPDGCCEIREEAQA